MDDHLKIVVPFAVPLKVRKIYSKLDKKEKENRK